MAAVTICSDFGAQKNKVWHCFPIYFPWSDGIRCHDLRFLNVELKANFFTLHFHFHKYFFSVNINSLVYCIIYYKKKRNINSSLYYGTTYNRCVKNPKFSSYFSVSISWSWILKPGVLKFMGFPGGLDSKESACKAGDLGLLHGLGRSSREGNG